MRRSNGERNVVRSRTLPSAASGCICHSPFTSRTPSARQRFSSSTSFASAHKTVSRPAGYQRSARSQTLCLPRRPTTATTPRPSSSSSMSVTLRLPHQSCGSRDTIRSASISRDSNGPLRSSSRSSWRLKRAVVSRKAVTRCSYIADPRFRRIRAQMSGKSSIGQMNAPHSNSLRSSQSRRSSSAGSYGPSLLQSTSCCGGATLDIAAVCRNPSWRTVSTTLFALPSSSCARTAMRRACARLTCVDFTAFTLSQLPAPRQRVLEVGCGREGGVAPALAAAGYDVLAIDPEAPAGPLFRSVSLEDLHDPGPFDAIVAGRVRHHVDPLGPALDKLAQLAPGLTLDEFAWNHMDAPTVDWYESQHRLLVAAGAAPKGPPNLAEWRARHMGLHPYETLRAQLDARSDTQLFEWRPY